MKSLLPIHLGYSFQTSLELLPITLLGWLEKAHTIWFNLAATFHYESTVWIHLLLKQSQRGWGWKGALGITSPNFPCSGRSSYKAGCSGPCPNGSWVISKDWDFTMSLGQCSFTCTIKCCLMSRYNSASKCLPWGLYLKTFSTVLQFYCCQ